MTTTESVGVRRSPWRVSLCMALAVSAMAVTTAACGAAPARPPGGAGGNVSGTPSVPLAFSACMGGYGVPDFPDAGGSGPMTRQTVDRHLVIDGVSLKETPAQFQTVQRACQRDLASGPGAGQPSAQTQQAARAYAQCMRAHGVSDFPDPTFGHGVTFATPPGFDPKAPQAQAADQACRSLVPGANDGGKNA